VAHLRTKFVCTLGPATESPEAIRTLVDAGLNVARVNMSHGSAEDHLEVIDRVRRAAGDADRPVAVLADLAGPKIRVGELESSRVLEEGQTVSLAPEAEAEDDEIPTTWPSLAAELEVGNRVLMDDGLLELVFEEREGNRARLRVVRGGELKSRKGINLPEVDLRAPAMTEKDLEDLEVLLEAGVDYLGLSFVRRAADVKALQERVDGQALVVAKIEKARALECIEEILVEADAVMVARGDLGVELPFEEVPLAQKRIIRLANHYGRPVITATQMLESMTDYPRPTRAEASDVANAILDGTDAVMLSGETAVGAYPRQSLEALVRIATEIEESGVMEEGPRYTGLAGSVTRRSGASGREHAVASASVDAARQLRSPALLVITRSGFSARLVSSYRPPIPVFAVCTDPRTYRQLAAVYGVVPLLSRLEEVTYDDLTQFGLRCIREQGLGRPGSAVVVTAGFPFHEPGSTNTMRVEEL
jgi:pyruvate kinase